MAKVLRVLQTALKDRYTIERELGRGGNAVVYLAHDKKHDRKVALKVLNPDLALAVRAERFLREIQIAAKLTHPHILALHDSGEASGLLFYVMPYVEGESLRDRLNREKQLPVDDALKITRDVVAALAYAHAQGVVHRDIKPENILLSHGEALVADFGIAMALSVAADGQTVTETGVAVGTPTYMSPEQAAASKTIDARSDIYSLGCVTYEMLAGHAPFTGISAQEILARHSLDPVPSLKAAREATPEAIERAVRKAMAKQPVDRFPTATEFAQALTAPSPGSTPRRKAVLYATIALSVVAIASALSWKYLRASERSIAVMPFTNLSTDSTDVYFSQGMTDELVTALGRVEGLRVVPIPAVYVAAHPKGVSPQDIGGELRVARVLEGTIRREGSELRIGARILNVDGTLEWSETYPRELRNMFAVQEELAHAIVGALPVKLGGSDRTLVRRPTENLEAYDLYLKGRYFLNQHTQDAVPHALQLFEAAIVRDSTYALAYSGLADASVYLGIVQYHSSPGDLLPRGKRAALKAVALDSSSAEAHEALAYAEMFGDWNWADAEHELRRAVALNPRYAEAHAQLCLLLSFLGRYGEAVREGGVAVRLDPLAVAGHNNLAFAYYYSGDHHEALREWRESAELSPRNPAVHNWIGSTYFFENQIPTAIAEIENALRLQPGRIASVAKLGALYAHVGRREAAQSMLNDLQGRVWREFAGEAIIQVHLGALDQAIKSLQRAVESRQVNLYFVLDPFLGALRSDPRYLALLKRIGLRR